MLPATGTRAPVALPSILLLGVFCCALANAAVVVRQSVAEGAFASIRDGQFIFLECRPGGDAAEQTLSPYLADPSQWTRYKGLQSVAIPLQQLSGPAQRRLLEALFPHDYADEKGWWHTVGFTGEQGEETLHAVADWLTGESRNVTTLLHLPENKGIGGRLKKGQRVFVPRSLLSAGLREPSQKRPGPAAEPVVANAPKEEPKRTEARAQAAPQKTQAPKAGRTAPRQEVRPAVAQSITVGAEEGEAGEPAQLAEGDLTYGQDAQGAYAAYRLKRGEAIYTAVVARFTDFQSSDDINRACQTVLSRSGVSDARFIDVGQSIRIPMEMLRDRYWPEESSERKEFEAMRQEAERLQETRVTSKGLSDVVVIIDPGHGGNDLGASHPASHLYEDELNYDIAVRLKRLLDATTQAKVYITLTDPRQGSEPCEGHRFTADKTEELLTTPRYWNEDAKVSANLRWYMANDIHEKEVRKGRDPRKIVFLSIHCDALHEKMRGTMIYVPGAKYRRDREQPEGVVYARYEETNNHAAATSTSKDRNRDEALSRNFAQAIIDSLQAHEPRIAVSKHGDPIRNVIRQGDGRAYVPAVLRNNMVPTKVLVETANLNNAEDRERLADPLWRQWYADALLNALLRHYKS